MDNKKLGIMKGILFFVLIAATSCSVKKPAAYKTNILEIEQLTKHTYIHLSFLETAQWGKVPCNGLVYINNGEAVIFDTPASDSAAAALADWVKNKMGAAIKAVVVNHFHDDCIAGLSVFHQKGIPSYASDLTLKMLKTVAASQPDIPQNGFGKELQLLIGDEKVINKYLGKGHAADNIVSYIPAEKVLFGGCLIKELGAKEGNLADADIKEWPNTVIKVKNEFPSAQYVVPGHGKWGDRSLLDYTINLFKNKK